MHAIGDLASDIALDPIELADAAAEWMARLGVTASMQPVVLDADPFAAGASALLTACVVETIVAGRSRYAVTGEEAH